MELEERFTIIRTGFTVDIEQITKARESLIAALASKQAKLLELNSQVAQLSAGIEELEHLTQTNTDLNKQAKEYQDQIGNTMNSWGPPPTIRTLKICRALMWSQVSTWRHGNCNLSLRQRRQSSRRQRILFLRKWRS